MGSTERWGANVELRSYSSQFDNWVASSEGFQRARECNVQE
jgi:hypothetical protein